MFQSSSRRRRRRRSGTRPESSRASGGSRRSPFKWLAKWLLIGGVSGAIAVAAGFGYLYYKIAPTLPDVESLREVQLQMPLRIYTAEGDLIAEYGEKRREPVQISEVPDSLINAIIAAEDKNFYSHPGVDWQGLARAGVYLVRTGRRGPGGSTITMQVARNFFLTNERTYSRKLTEIFLALKIERELAKDEILELYVNKIYLGNRSYGYAAASKVYYGKKITELELVESAMMAGLPKAPSRYNPIVNPERALIRRDYVLGRMLALDMIDQSTYDTAVAQPVSATLHYSKPEAEAAYIGEMARARVQQLFGNDWATAGYNVFTSIRADAQRSANAALRGALFDYEGRHGYRGPVTTLDAETLADAGALLAALDDLPTPGGLIPAAVIAVDAESATLVAATGSEYTLALADVEWARKRIDVDARGDEIAAVDEVLTPGDVIHLTVSDAGSVRFVQEPGVEGAFVAMEPSTGEIMALVGGFDYYRSKFNRVTQARRQPGSTFKPFIYSAALAKGDTPATIYNDAPVVFHDAALEGEWRPSNYSGRFFGPTRLREALVKSRNLVSVRVLREIGIPFAIDHARRFGFAESNLPPDLSLALGSAAVTPIELATAFGVFANGGYKVQPHFIDRIEDPRGRVVYATPRVILCDDCNAEEPSPLQAEMDAENEVPTLAEGTDDSALEAATGEAGDAAAAADALGDPEAQLAADAAEETARRARADLMPPDTIDAPRVLDARNAWIMSSMMREVVRRGTARRAGEALGRSDLGGKTGTTNNQLDAWFAGFNDKVVAAAWIGSDGLDPLGRGEAGGVAALPMWTAYMAETLKDVPETELTEPPGIETLRIDQKTGEPASGDGTMLEIFMDDNLPDGADVRTDGVDGATVSDSGDESAAQLEPRTAREQIKEVEQLF